MRLLRWFRWFRWIFPSSLLALQTLERVYSLTTDVSSYKHPIVEQLDRRKFCFKSIATLTLLKPSSAVAQEGKSSLMKKPFAPIETLLPAIRVQQSIERAIQLTTSLMEEEGPKTEEAIKQLGDILLQPQNYVQPTLVLQGVPSKPADLYLESYKPMKGDLPLQRALIQNGDVRTWKQLKKAEKAQERTSEIRAALNAYTDALSFSDRYLLNVDKPTQSAMVREDRLPDVKQVITSDMGLRYLYRNQVLTAMDDVKAEFAYQVTKKSSLDGNDWTDLLDLLKVADTSMNQWFSLVDSQDVKDALEMAVNDSTLQQS